MKKTLIVLFFLSYLTCNAQTHLKDSIIYLEEVTLNAKNKKSHTFKTKGRKNTTISLSNDAILISKIKLKTNGNLKNIQLFFNSMKNTTFRNVEFELILMNTDKSGNPNNFINKNPFYFNVHHTHKGVINLNISELNISVNKEFFIGLRKISDTGLLDFSIDLQSKKKEIVYIKLNEEKWHKIEDSNIRLKIAYDKE